ncbi:MAG: sulfur carrier protein ThiS [Beijerinckiaceae bacterium]|nr:sulfur carrier protein ThiS [Beijerinckiaceae bacterium]
MRLHINGQPREANAATLNEIWEVEARMKEIDSPRGFAIALNGRVVPKNQWPDTPISDGDQIEIIRALSGG